MSHLKRSFFILILVTLTAASAQTELRLWHMEQPPYRVDRVQEIIDAFNEANPDVRVRQEVQSWEDVVPMALSAVQAGIQPDLIFTIPDFTVTMRATGVVQPLTDIAQGLADEHGFLDAALDPYSYAGEVWAVPLYGMTHSLWYRKDMLEEAGLEPPSTWDELLEVAAALTGDGRYGIGIPGSRSLYTDQVIYNFMVTAGAEELFREDGEVRFDNPDTVRAFEFYNELYQYSPSDSVGWIWGDAEAAFAAGQVAMIVQFTTITTFDQQTDELPENLGVVPIPTPSEDGQAGSIYYSNGVMLLTDEAEKRDAAARFIAHLLEPETYGRFLNMEPGLFLPVTLDGQDAESFWSDELVVAYRDQVDTMIDNSQHGALFGFTGDEVFDVIGPISAQNLLSQVVQRMLIDGDSPEAAVSWGQAEMEDAAR